MALRTKRGRDGVRRLVKVKRRKLRRSAVRVPRNVSNMVTSVMPLPSSKRSKIKYCQYVQLDAGAGLASTQTFSANSLYDPDVSGAGHQPRGFDQMMTMYRYYTVLGATIEVQAITVGGTIPITGCMLFLSCSQDSAPYTSSIFDYAEQPGVVQKLHPGDPGAKSVLKLNVDIPKLTGFDAKDGALKALVGASPSAPCYFHFTQASTDLATTNPQAITTLITIVYDVRFDSLIEPTAS